MAISISLGKKEDDRDEELLLFPEAGRASDGVGSQNEPSWLGHREEGRLAVDVHETTNEIVVRSAIAGVRPEDIEVFVQGDMLTIRGSRNVEDEPDARPLVRECHWGAFSRSVILPSETDADRIGATLKDGVLTVRLPKIERSRRIDIREI